METLEAIFKGEMFTVFDGLVTIWTVLFGLAVFIAGLLSQRLKKNHHAVSLLQKQRADLEISNVNLMGKNEELENQLSVMMSRQPDHQAAHINSTTNKVPTDKKLDILHNWLLNEKPHLLSLCRAASIEEDLSNIKKDDLALIERYCMFGLSLEPHDLVLKRLLGDIGRAQLSNALKSHDREQEAIALEKIDRSTSGTLDDIEINAVAKRSYELAKRHEYKSAITLMRQAISNIDNPEVDKKALIYRAAVASWTGKSGDAAGALTLFKALLPDQDRVLGKDHPDALNTRHSIAIWTGENGDGVGALTLSKALLPDQERVLGHEHSDALRTRHTIAAWTGETGDAAEALTLFKALLPDQVRVFGMDHLHTLNTRHSIATWTGSCGDTAGALTLYKALLSDQERVLGNDHPGALKTRQNIAASTGRNGVVVEALTLFKVLLPDQERVLGKGHPDTLRTRQHIAAWTGENGDTAEALTLFKALLPDQDRVLGKEHPDALNTRKRIKLLARSK